jgi:signal transduction histidine kinase
MTRLGQLARRHGFDALIVLAALEAAIEMAVRHGSADAPETSRWLAMAGVVLIVLPLLARRRFPFAAPASLWLVAAALSFADGRLVVYTGGVYIAGVAAAFLLGNLSDPVKGRLGLAVVVGSAAVVMYNDPDRSAGDVVFVPLLFGIGWLVGYALGERAAQAEAAEARASQAERERETTARLAVAEERARIARELHDVVAHAVSVMVLQVGAARHTLPAELAPARDALLDVERTGRSALSEMRRLLGAMRSERDELELAPRPGLGGLDRLLEEIRRAGLCVGLHVEGEAFALPPAIDLSAYRIVQEGLTNSLKHAGAGRADVVVRYASDELEIEVHDDGRGAKPSDGLGHGLVGIRERVTLFGGDMVAGSENGGGFVLRTRLPVDRRGQE